MQRKHSCRNACVLLTRIANNVCNTVREFRISLVYESSLPFHDPLDLLRIHDTRLLCVQTLRSEYASQAGFYRMHTVQDLQADHRKLPRFSPLKLLRVERPVFTFVKEIQRESTPLKYIKAAVEYI